MSARFARTHTRRNTYEALMAPKEHKKHQAHEDYTIKVRVASETTKTLVSNDPITIIYVVFCLANH